MLKLSNEVKSKHKERISDELRFVSTKGRSESRASGYFNIGSSFSFLNTSSRTILCLWLRSKSPPSVYLILA